jgi:hypothetical protein
MTDYYVQWNIAIDRVRIQYGYRYSSGTHFPSDAFRNQVLRGADSVEGISDIKIIGIDEKRPPKIRKEPYIDIFFKLSHQAPVDWCQDFNAMLSKHPTSPKIKEKEGLYIETWVRKPDEIVTLLAHIKDKIAQCNQQYIERVERSIRNASNGSASLAMEEAGEQGRLNRIIAALDFDETGPQ